MEQAVLKRKDKGVDRILIDAGAVQQRVRELAAELDKIYAHDTPLLVGVLNGAITFMTDLMREMDAELKVDFMAVSSYGDDVTSSGAVRILKDLNENIEGRRVLIVEDIVDSGLTLNYLLDVLRRRNPADIKVVALLRKPKAEALAVQADLVGFDIPDEFVIGYGLDYAGRYRNLPYIGVLDPTEIEVTKSKTAILSETPPLQDG
jgi:hypoxanthine phosphoribosyltransferase